MDECAVRGEGFVAGRWVRLADGQEWSLPVRSAVGVDPEYDALLGVVFEAESRAEGLRAELALTIFLLTRNYVLSSDALDRLLRFASADPALATLQRAVHELVLESMELSRAAARSWPRIPRVPRSPGTVSSTSPRARSLGTLGMR
jgi:hypothetical protein